jgi:hypothetical protein
VIARDRKGARGNDPAAFSADRYRKAGMRRSLRVPTMITGIAAATALASGCGVGGPPGPEPNTTTRTVGFGESFSTLKVATPGGAVQVTAGGTGGVQVTETLHYGENKPTVEQSTTGSTLSLSVPYCGKAQNRCSVDFRITVPAAISANLTSGGGDITVFGLSGRVEAGAAGGSLTARNLSGTLTANTGGGAIDAADLTSTDVSVNTAGGPTSLTFTKAPTRINALTGGGNLTLQLPAVMYALHLGTGGGTEAIGIPNDPSSSRTVTASTAGGNLTIKQTGG